MNRGDKGRPAAAPERVYALVVGVESYKIGAEWDLPGAARDAVRFAAWLTGPGQVPAANIRMLLSPLRRNELTDAQQLPEELRQSVQAATEERVDAALFKDLPRQDGDLLWFFWAGHGFLDNSLQLLLPYADADESHPKCLNLESMLRRWMSTSVPANRFLRQVVLGDACRVHPSSRLAFDTTDYGRGQVVGERKQFVLYACRPGEAAQNLAERAAGQFTELLLNRLRTRTLGQSVAEMAEIAREVQADFRELHRSGEAWQQPQFRIHRGWDGSPLFTADWTDTSQGRPPQPAQEETAARDPLTYGIAARTTTLLFTAVPRDSRVPGPEKPQRRALERAFTRAFQRLAVGLGLTTELAAAVEDQLRGLVTDPAVAETLLAAALEGTDLDQSCIRTRFEDLGPGSETLLSNFETALSGFRYALADELVRAAGEPGTAGRTLFATDVLARLKSTQEHLEGDEADWPAGVPRTSRYFVGRDKELRDLKLRLRQGSRPQVLTAVRGWPGVGKTTIAARLAKAKSFVDEAFPDGVLWASVADASRINAALASWIRLLKLPSPEVRATSEEMRLILASALRDRQALLIVDDVWDAAHVVPFNVGGAGCAMLVTTRLPEVARALAAEVDIYPLGLLSEEASLELLRQLAPDVVNHHPDESRQLVRTLERLPLAVQVAGDLLRAEWANGWGIDELLASLEDGAQLLESKAPVDRAGPDHTIPTVQALLRTSTDRLDEETRLRFADLGPFAPKPTTFRLEDMAYVWEITDTDAKTTVRKLRDRGLLEPDGRGRFTMHALLVLHAKALLREAG